MNFHNTGKKLNIGIALATYNGEKFLKDQFESLLKQTVLPDHIVICDDCSTDNTQKIIKEFMEKTTIPVSFLKHDSNEGVSSSFRDSVSECDSDIIFFCDQDDYWYANKIEEFLKVFESNPDCALVFSDAEIVDECLNKTGVSLWDTLKFCPGKNSLIKEMFKRNVFTGMSMAVKIDWLEGLTGYSDYMLHDEFIGWNAVLTGKATALNKCLAGYRQHTDNVVGSAAYTQFNSTGQMKKKVHKSSERTWHKFTDLKKLVESGSKLQKQFDRAEKFYHFRATIQEQKKIKVFFVCLKEGIKGNYIRYCSRTERAFIKDIACIIL